MILPGRCSMLRHTVVSLNRMSQEILSMAIFEPLAGLEAECLATFTSLFQALARGGYSRDFLHRDSKSATYVLLRYWASEDARNAALEDPEVLRCWAKLAEQIRILRVFETLQAVELPGQSSEPAPPLAAGTTGSWRAPRPENGD